MTTSPLFYCAEISVQFPGLLAVPSDSGWGNSPHGTLAETTDPVAFGTTLLVSDAGYVTRSTDTAIAGSLSGVQAYVPCLTAAYQFQRAVNLDPSDNAVAASWGALSLINTDGRWDQMTTQYVVDGHPVKMYYGVKTLENYSGWHGTRASTATYIDGNGVMQLAAINVPRGADYSTGAPLPLFEATSTNWVANDNSLPTTGSPNTLALSADVPSLYSPINVYKSVCAGNAVMASRALAVSLTTIAVGQTVTVSCYVWLPVAGFNPFSRIHFVLEAASATLFGTIAQLDLTQTGRWIRVSSSYTNNTAGAVSTNAAVFRADHPCGPNGPMLEYSALGATRATTATLDPFGGTNAVLLTEDTSTAEHRLNGLPTPVTPGAVYTHSAYVKAGTSNFAVICLRPAGSVAGGFSFVTINLTTGACNKVNGASSVTFGSQSVGSGWWRVWVTGAFNTGVGIVWNGSIGVAKDATTYNYSGAGTASVYVYGCWLDQGTTPSAFVQYPADTIYTTSWQIETGSPATLYIPTTGAPVTRAADNFHSARLNWVDPPYSQLVLGFAGMATDWTRTATSLDIPVRDATYWAERPYNTSVFAGTTGYNGAASLSGVPLPILRGTCSNITPVLIDPTNRIYQYNNAAGTIQNIYEGGAIVWPLAGDVADLYVGTTPAGQYRTSNARGMFQLGSTPVHQVTVDATGSFPTAGSQTTVCNIARYMLTEDMLIPAANIDVSSFTTANTAYPYPAGVYFGDGQTYTGIDALAAILANFAAKVIINRVGQLSMFVLRALPNTTLPKLALTPDNIVQITPKQLPSSLMPPPYRWRVGYQHNWTVQTSDLNTGTTTPDHKAFIAVADRYGSASSNAILNAYVRPNDHAAIGGGLTTQANAQTVANDLLALWGGTRKLFTVTLPTPIGIAVDLGDPVSVRFPAITALANGALGVIVAESFNTGQGSVDYDILI